jgi:hypothetical protein
MAFLIGYSLTPFDSPSPAKLDASSKEGVVVPPPLPAYLNHQKALNLLPYTIQNQVNLEL